MGICLVYGRHRSTRDRLTELVGPGRMHDLPPFDELRRVATAPEVLAALSATPCALVIIGIDDGDPPHTWLDVLRHARGMDPPVPGLVVGPGLDGTASDPATQPAALALAHGARGYLRTCDLSNRDDSVAPVLTPPRPRTAELSPRETDVLLGMTEGLSNAEIAGALVLAEDTVKTHARRLFRKLGAGDRADAVARGFRQGLIR